MPDFLAVATERQNDMQRERTGNLRPKFPAAMLFRDVTGREMERRAPMCLKLGTVCPPIHELLMTV